LLFELLFFGEHAAFLSIWRLLSLFFAPLFALLRIEEEEDEGGEGKSLGREGGKRRKGDMWGRGWLGGRG
jgi:hypothetical protein